MTDPEARLMKMADGGFRPAYNVQLATDAPTRILTGIEVITSGSDRGQLAPMVEQHQERYGEPPKEMLADGGFATKPDITTISETGQTTVYAPVQRPKNAVRDPHAAHPGDSPAVVVGTAYPQVARRAKQVLDSLARDEALLEASPPEPR